MIKERPVLALEKVGKTFQHGSQTTEVLRDVDLTVARGEFISIIGHSGCGKSTMLNLIAGLTRVTTGVVLLGNKEVNAPGPDRAVVFQNHSLLPWLTVYENVRLAVDKVFSGKKSRAQRHEWTMQNLALVHMTHATDKRPGEISGGMNQRVGLARALAMEPKIMLMDEPFGALMAAGVRPEASLVRAAGLTVERGVLVDDRLTTSHPHIYAIGECAQHRGACYGLVGPAYEQAAILAGVLCGEPHSYPGTVIATNLKVSGVPVFSAGDFEGAAAEHIIYSDGALPAYRKLVLRENRLVGAVLYGDTADSLWYLGLIRSGRPVSDIRAALPFGQAFAEAA